MKSLVGRVIEFVQKLYYYLAGDVKAEKNDSQTITEVKQLELNQFSVG